MQPMFTFNEESAKKSGAGGISETGAYTGTIAAALFTNGRDSQSAAMEFSLETDAGKANYLRVNYIGRDGQPLQHGEALINAIMGLTRVNQLNASEGVNDQGEPAFHCKELEGKPIGFVLQKVLYTKTDGTDAYKFEVRQAFGSNTRKTFKEASEGMPAEAVDKMLLLLKDRDERLPAGNTGSAIGQPARSMLGGNQPAQSRLQQRQPQNTAQQTGNFDDDIPF